MTLLFSIRWPFCCIHFGTQGPRFLAIEPSLMYALAGFFSNGPYSHTRFCEQSVQCASSCGDTLTLPSSRTSLSLLHTFSHFCFTHFTSLGSTSSIHSFHTTQFNSTSSRSRCPLLTSTVSLHHITSHFQLLELLHFLTCFLSSLYSHTAPMFA